MKDLFRKFDSNGDGKFSYVEFSRLVFHIDHTVTEALCLDAFHLAVTWSNRFRRYSKQLQAVETDENNQIKGVEEKLENNMKINDEHDDDENDIISVEAFTAAMWELNIVIPELKTKLGKNIKRQMENRRTKNRR